MLERVIAAGFRFCSLGLLVWPVVMLKLRRTVVT